MFYFNEWWYKKRAQALFLYATVGDQVQERFNGGFSLEFRTAEKWNQARKYHFSIKPIALRFRHIAAKFTINSVRGRCRGRQQEQSVICCCHQLLTMDLE